MKIIQWYIGEQPSLETNIKNKWVDREKEPHSKTQCLGLSLL